MRLSFIILVYAHIFSFANPSFGENRENGSYLNIEITGEMTKFVFHKESKPIEDLLVLYENKREIDLMTLGHKFILLNFWATWCAPCVEEMPSLDKLQSLFRQENLKIFTVATGRNNQKKNF